MGRTEYTHVLLVDQDDAFAANVDRALPSCFVDRVETAADARDASKSARCGAWIVAKRLRDGDGVELLRWLRERDARARALVVVETIERAIIERVVSLSARAITRSAPSVALEELDCELSVASQRGGQSSCRIDWSRVHIASAIRSDSLAASARRSSQA